MFARFEPSVNRNVRYPLVLPCRRRRLVGSLLGAFGLDLERRSWYLGTAPFDCSLDP